MSLSKRLKIVLGGREGISTQILKRQGEHKRPKVGAKTVLRAFKGGKVSQFNSECVETFYALKDK